MSVPDERPGPVVVGFDGRRPSFLALDWAVDDAQRRHLPLHVIYARELPLGNPFLTPRHLVPGGHAEAVLARAVQRAHELAPALNVTTDTPVAEPARVLVAESARADSVVVGAPGRRLTGTLLGPTSGDVCAHAECPVVVVRRLTEATDDRPPVVVGVDGSAISIDAVGYAFEQAAAREVGLTVVHTWWLKFAGAGVAVVADEQERRMTIHEGRAIVAEAVAGWAKKFPDVDVRQQVVAGHPVESLVSRSREAELVVVGSRGRGGFKGMLLGSVSQGVLQSARCPVAVVRPWAGVEAMSAGARA